MIPNANWGTSREPLTTYLLASGQLQSVDHSKKQ